MPRKISLQLFDIDGCLFRQVSDIGFAKRETKVQEWLISTNKPLWDYIAKQHKEEKFDSMTVGFGTNRGDQALNKHLIERGSTSFAPALPIIQNYLDSKLDCRVDIDPFLLADAYSPEPKPAGESYKSILKEEYCNSKTEEHAKAVLDHTKITLIYARAHRMAALNRKDEIVIDFYDDHSDILQDINNFFGTEEGKKLLPKNVKLRLHQYDNSTEELLKPKYVIQGTGHRDKNYHWTIKWIALSAHNKIKIKPDTEKSLLETYQATYEEYKKSHWDIRLDSENFKTEKLRTVRRKRVKTMEKSKDLLQANFTTSAGLLKEKIIPQRFVQFLPAPKMVKKQNSAPNENLKAQSHDDFKLSKEAHQKIIAEIKKYLNSRKGKKDNRLNWLTRHFRDYALSFEKATIAQEFWQQVEVTRNYYDVKSLVKRFIEKNAQAEKDYNKIYGIFSSSDLLNSFENISSILREERNQIVFGNLIKSLQI